jgi:uncharacterized membrane protein
MKCADRPEPRPSVRAIRATAAAGGVQLRREDHDMAEASRPTRPLNLLHPHLIGPGAAFLIGAFATDLLYWRTVNPEWETFSIWLLTGGLVLAALAGLGLLLDVLLRRVRAIDWLRFAALTAAALLSFLNAFIHSRDGYTAVVPQGLLLSAIATLLLLVVGWRGWSLAAVRPSPTPSSQGASS